MAKTCKNTQASLLFLALLLIASFYAFSLDSSVIFEEHGTFSAPKESSRALLQTPKAKKTTMKLLPKDQTTTPAAAAATTTAAAAARKERQFQMAAHEVPSGPNPESN